LRRAVPDAGREVVEDDHEIVGDAHDDVASDRGSDGEGRLGIPVSLLDGPAHLVQLFLPAAGLLGLVVYDLAGVVCSESSSKGLPLGRVRPVVTVVPVNTRAASKGYLQARARCSSGKSAASSAATARAG
jgi:hypothetical protein